MKTPKFLKTSILVLISASVFVSCASVNNVVTDYNVSTDFSKFTTYNFWDDVKLNDEVTPEYDQLDERRIKEAIARSLESKGYRFSEEIPSLLVNINIIVKTRRNATSFNQNPYWGWRFGGANNININEYEEATIVVDLVDAKKNVLVWQGSVRSPDVRNPEERDRKIQDAVMKMMLNFRHRAGQNIRPSSD